MFQDKAPSFEKGWFLVTEALNEAGEESAAGNCKQFVAADVAVWFVNHKKTNMVIPFDTSQPGFKEFYELCPGLVPQDVARKKTFELGPVCFCA